VIALTLPHRFYFGAAMDCFFVVDLVLNFFTGYVLLLVQLHFVVRRMCVRRYRDQDGRLVLALDRIRSKYMKVTVLSSGCPQETLVTR
jgi:hypothetical protein